MAQDPRPPAGPKGGARPLQPPGSYWEYNDVRINQLALALLHLFRRPLPEVFLERLLRPLGGGEGFAWRGYDDAWIELPGVGRVQSVPGGTHWGARRLDQCARPGAHRPAACWTAARPATGSSFPRPGSSR